MQPLLRRMKEKFLVAVGKELIGVSEEEAEKYRLTLRNVAVSAGFQILKS